jgi:4a-hydroxytetrahydrobiopterin dehydratase
MARLTSEQVETELAAAPGWALDNAPDGAPGKATDKAPDGGAITRTVTRKDFRDSLLYLNAVGYLAERANHHPDVEVSWNKVTLTLSTHSEGGLTARDFALARQINDLG